MTLSVCHKKELEHHDPEGKGRVGIFTWRCPECEHLCNPDNGFHVATYRQQRYGKTWYVDEERWGEFVYRRWWYDKWCKFKAWIGRA